MATFYVVFGAHMYSALKSTRNPHPIICSGNPHCRKKKFSGTSIADADCFVITVLFVTTETDYYTEAL